MDDFNKRLIPVTIRMQDNVWDIIPEQGSNLQHFNVKTTTDKMRKVLYHIKAKDGTGGTRSKKYVRYMDMLSDLENRGEVTINVWKGKYPQSIEDFNNLMEGVNPSNF